MMDKGNVLFILWIGALCVTIGANKDQPWKPKPGMERFFKALTREVDHHLKTVLRQSFTNQVSTEASANLPYTEAEYSKDLQMDIKNFFDALKKAVKLHTDKSSGFPGPIKVYKTSPVPRTTKAPVPTTEAYTKAPVPATKAHTKAPVPTTEAYTKAPVPTTKAYTKAPVPTTETYTKAPVSTTEDCVKGHHGMEEVYEKSDHATAEGYGKEHDDTAEGYGKEHDATAEGYGKGDPSIGCLIGPVTTSPVSHGPAIRVGSLKGVPGVHFPNCTDIPLTSFTCYDKEYQPGFYADMETGCQVFHVCWSNRRESFLCPLGTTFNQALLACDYWYSTNCALTPHYYSKNAETSQYEDLDLKSETLSSMVNVLLQKGYYSEIPTGPSTPDGVLSFISQFLPVKAKIIVYPETGEKRAKVVASTSIGVGKASKIQKVKSVETLAVSREQKPIAERHSHVPKRTESTPKPEIRKDAEKADSFRKAVEVFLSKLAVAVKLVIKEIVDIADKNGTAKSRPPVLGKSKFDVDHNPGYADTKESVNRIIQGLIDWFRDGTKPDWEKLLEPWKKDAVQKVDPSEPIKLDSPEYEDTRELLNELKDVSLDWLRKEVNIKDSVKVPQPVKKDVEQKVIPEPVKKDVEQKVIPEPVKKDVEQKVPKPVKYHTLTQLNPKFIIKPAVIQKEVPKHKQFASHPRKLVTIEHSKMSVPKPGKTIGLNILPLTKKRLIGNYIRLLKIKSA